MFFETVTPYITIHGDRLSVLLLPKVSDISFFITAPIELHCWTYLKSSGTYTFGFSLRRSCESAEIFICALLFIIGFIGVVGLIHACKSMVGCGENFNETTMRINFITHRLSLYAAWRWASASRLRA